MSNTLEQYCIVRCNQLHYGSVSGGGAAPESANLPEVVGSGIFGSGVDSGSVKSGRDVREGRRGGQIQTRPMRVYYCVATK